MNLDKLRTDIARDLREIRLLCRSLLDEAINRADDPEIPGGDPMVMMGPSADPEAWSYRQLAAALGRTLPHGLYENEADPTPPLLVLSTWEDALRKERGQWTDLTATIDRATDYILGSLDWAFTDLGAGINFVAVDEMADALRGVKRNLEGVLHAGERDDKGAPCLAHGRPYVKQWAGVDEGPDQDRWYCMGDGPNAGHWATEDEYRLALRATWRAYSDWLTAIDMEAQYRVRAGTVVLWAHRGKVRKKKDSRSGRMLYNVADTRGLRDCESL